jgi:hypothetical protein
MDQQRRDKPEHEFNVDDPLGIAREPVPQEPSEQMLEANDEAAIRRRRARAGLDGHAYDEHGRPGMGDVNVDADGAAGTDMGYGGEGTDVKP